MEISIPVAVTYVSSNITDTTPLFDNTLNQTYATNDVRREGDNIYKNAGADIVPFVYDVAVTYSSGDIVYKAGVLTKVSVHDTTMTFNTITTIADLTGYELYTVIDEYKILDSKNYSKVTKAGNITYSISMVGMFDTVAFGRILADTIDIEFRDSVGTLIHAITGEVIDNKRDADSRLPSYPTTSIFHSPFDIDGGSINFTIYGAYTELGEVVVGLSTGAGFTEPVFSNEFNDWSPKTRDKFGNWEYIDGVKTMVHSGKCDVPLKNYDMLSRLMMSIAMNTVILNGSDAKNYGGSAGYSPNGKDIFSSTMMIGRVTSHKQSTKLRGNKLDKNASYTFTIEENV